MTKILIMLSMFFLITGCSLKEHRLFQAENEKVTEIGDAAYEEEVRMDNIIAIGERVTVNVYNQLSQGGSEIGIANDNSFTTTTANNIESIGQLVSKMGTIRLPLIGTVKISGLTEIEAAEMLTLEYKKFLRQPYVSVALINQRVIVIGEVKRPGVVNIANGSMTLIEAIARSGDLNDYAERTNIKIIRGDLRSPEVRIIDLTQLSSIKLSSMILKGNDIVYVQPRSLKGVNLAIQEVSPLFGIVSTMLQPFVNIIYLNESLK